MVTKEDVISQLGQPVKDIADWSFPLAELLEAYLQLRNSMSFNEASIVVQNSTKAYISRLENLHKAIVLQQETPEKENATAQQCGTKRKAMTYNFDNFHLIDMEKRIGRNINLKEESGVKEAIKLLSRRFPELEDFDVSHSRPPIHIYDVAGEIIGKKDDYRCNQPMDINGMLVDELTPDEPDCLFNSLIKRGGHIQITSEIDTPRTASSGYMSNRSKSNASNFDRTEDLDMDIATNDTDNEEVLVEHPTEQETMNESGFAENSKLSIDKIPSTKEKVLTQNKRSERLKKSQLATVSKLISNAWKIRKCVSKPASPTKVRKTVAALRNTVEKTRKRPGPRNYRKNGCIQSLKDALNNALCYKSVLDNCSNLLGFRCSNSVVEHQECSTSDINRSLSSMDTESRADSVSPHPCMDPPDFSCNIPDYRTQIEDKMNEIFQECDVRTESEQAVAEWHRSLQPKLFDAEKRAAFDLEEYQSDIISNLSTHTDKTCDFGRLVNGKSSYEVSRYFLASLHLANAYNIEICHKDDVGMEMTLLKEKPASKKSRT